MNVIELKPDVSMVLAHREPGDIVRVLSDDISKLYNAVYMVLPTHVAAPGSTADIRLVDVMTGQTESYHPSTRCTFYKDATLQLNKGFTDE